MEKAIYLMDKCSSFLLKLSIVLFSLSLGLLLTAGFFGMFSAMVNK